MNQVLGESKHLVLPSICIVKKLAADDKGPFGTAS
jgi:hypothetical protein